MRSTPATLLATLLALPACGRDGGSRPAAPPRTVACTLPPGDAPDLDALYEVTVTGGDPARGSRAWEWHLWRRRDSVETRESRGNTGEAWRRDGSGRILGCDRLFHAVRRVIEMNPGDLAATGEGRDWNLLGSLLDPRILGRGLRRTGSSTVASRAAEAYSGEIHGAACEVLWVPSLGLPARLRRTRGDGTVEFTLREVHPPGRAPWDRPDAADYRRTDFADIGDAPSDPFLRRFAHAPGPAHPGHE